MKFRLECPYCGKKEEYVYGDIIWQNSDIPTAETAEQVKLNCKNCAQHFKVPKKRIDDSLEVAAY